MAELADALASNTSAPSGREGSTPSLSTEDSQGLQIMGPTGFDLVTKETIDCAMGVCPIKQASLTANDNAYAAAA